MDRPPALSTTEFCSELWTDAKDGLSDESKGVTQGEVIRDYEPAHGANHGRISWKWRFGRPDYATVNKLLMKNWDVESRHIASTHHWHTMDVSNLKAAINGGCPFNAQLLSDMSHANVLTQAQIGETTEYSSKASNAEAAQQNFAAAFPEGFAWEVLEVFSGPPNVTFKWRHFGKMCGTFKDKQGKDSWQTLEHKGNGEMLNIIGLCIAKVTEDLKIESVDVNKCQNVEKFLPEEDEYREDDAYRETEVEGDTISAEDKVRSVEIDEAIHADIDDNPIGSLQNIVAKHLGRPVVKGDVDYSFDCYPAFKKANAKKSAAKEALAELSSEDGKREQEQRHPQRNSTKGMGGGGQKQGFQERPKHNKLRSGGCPQLEHVSEKPMANPVGALNEKIAAIVRRQLTKDDISYSFDVVGQHFICTVSVDLECLGIGHEILQASSEPAKNKKEAKILAAEALLSSDLSDFAPFERPNKHHRNLEEQSSVLLLYEIVQLLLRTAALVSINLDIFPPSLNIFLEI
eukprot:g9158.t1